MEKVFEKAEVWNTFIYVVRFYTDIASTWKVEEYSKFFSRLSVVLSYLQLSFFYNIERLSLQNWDSNIHRFKDSQSS